MVRTLRVALHRARRREGAPLSWQDLTFAAGSVVFALALLPTVLGRHKPELSTSAVTAAVLAVYVGAFASLGLWWAAATDGLTTALWAVIAAQRLRRDAADRALLGALDEPWAGTD